jgi:drug/metabolite transporter (DMT)-like permease
MALQSALIHNPRAQVAAAATLFSTGGLAIKACSLTGWQIAAFRGAIAALALAFLAPAARRIWNRPTLVVAVPYAATIILFTLANRATTAANAILLQDTAPLWVLLLAPWLLGERVTARDVGSMVLIGVGLALLVAGSGEPMATAPDPARGNALAVTAGLTWALTLIGLRWLAHNAPREGNSALAGALAGNLLAGLAAAPFALPVTGASAADWVLVGYLGVFQIACAYLLLGAAMARLPAFEISLLLLVEPVLAPIWTWLALGETVGALAIAGGATIIGATALRAWQNRDFAPG